MAISSGSLRAGFKKATSERLFTNWRLSLIGIFAFSIALYLRALSGTPISDDFQHLAGSSIGSASLTDALTKPFLHDYYRPLTSLSYYLDLKLWGPNPAMMHLTNIIIHGFAAVGVAALAWIAIRCKHAAVFAGLFFAVQPAQVGAVAWIGGRTDELSALFATVYLISLVYYFNSGKRWILASAALLLFLACAVKEQNVGFVLAAPIFERAFGTHTKRRAIGSTVVVGVAVLAFAVLWLACYPNPHAFAGPGLVATARRVVLAYWHYAGMLVIPSPRAMTALSLSAYGWFWLLPAVALSAATPWIVKAAYRFDDRAGAFLLTFLLVYLPISNIITIPSTQVAPYRIANASILIALLFGFLLADFVSKKRWVGAGLLAANLGLSMAVSFWTIGKWTDGVDWWTTSLQFDPHDRLVVKSAASALLNSPNGSIKAAEVTEDYLNWLFDGNSWEVAIDQGQLPALTPQLREKLVLGLGGMIDTHVLLAQLLNVRGAALVNAHQNREALNSYLAGYRLSPSNGFPSGIGDLLINSDRRTALFYYKIAVMDAPDYHNFSTYGKELRKDGDNKQAAEYLVAALKINPEGGDAWVQLGLAELALGDREKAQLCLKTASGFRFDQPAFDQLAQLLH